MAVVEFWGLTHFLSCAVRVWGSIEDSEVIYDGIGV